MTTIHASQTNRLLHGLAFSRQVWLALLSDLHARLFIDLFPGRRLTEHTTAELINLAKRAVCGPQSWSGTHLSGPCVSRQITLNLGRVDSSNYVWGGPVKLLAGGQFILFQSSTALECRNIAENGIIWEYRCEWNTERYMWAMPFVADVVDEGRAVNILIGIRTLEQRRRK